MVVEVLERAMDYFARDTSRGFIGINKNDIILYDPIKLSDKAIKEAVDFIIGDEMMELGDKVRLERLFKELTGKDWFMTFPDFDDYVETREKAYADYENSLDWAEKMLVNIPY